MPEYEKSSLQDLLDGLPVVRTAQDLEALLQPWFAQKAAHPSPQNPPLDASDGPGTVSSSAWIQLSPPLLPAAYLLERARTQEGPLKEIAGALEILCDALATGCADTLRRGYEALGEALHAPHASAPAVSGRLLKPCSVQARTAFYVLKEESDIHRVNSAVHLRMSPDAQAAHREQSPSCIETLPDEDEGA